MNTKILQCPICKGENISKDYICIKCETHFPIVNNKPILINEDNSIFTFLDYGKTDCFTFFDKNNVTSTNKSMNLIKRSKAIIKKMKPSLDLNLCAVKNYTKFAETVLSKTDKPLILVLGGGVLGQGMKAIINNKDLEFIETDVSMTDRIHLVCDAHDIPFKDKTFDGVIIQAVLEHVVDPYRCVEEIYRVLKTDGIVYAETPFIQQVHGGAYDFTRFTFLGHRRLFRHFVEINMGMACGPGMALALSYCYFFQSFSRGRISKFICRSFAQLTSFFWKYFDLILQHNPQSLNAASGYFFMGEKKEDYILTDRDLIKIYKKIQ